MKLSILLLANIIFIPALCFANDKPQTCTWVNIYEDNKEEQITTQPIYSGQGNTQYESCQEAKARKKRQVEVRFARHLKGKHLTGGTRDNCTWPSSSNDFPDVAAHQYKLTLGKIGEDENGEPIYESCTSAKARKQQEWINNNFDGYREDAENFIKDENQKLQDKALSANQKAQKAAKKQKTVSLVANAGAIAAGIKFAASCSGMGTCNYTWAAISASLMLAGQVLNSASDKNNQTARQYRGLADYNSSSSSSASTGSNTTSGIETGNNPPGVSDGGNTSINPGNNINIQDPNLTPSPIDDIKVTIPGTNEKLSIGSSETEKFLGKKGIKYDANKNTITLPNGETYTAEELNNHPALKNFASTPAGAGFKKTMAGLEKQIAAATGEDLGSDEDSSNTASVGGGGFSGYDKGISNDMGSSGGATSLMASLDKTKKLGRNVAGMSVKVGKNHVGVSQDNIFEMIHRRYQVKREKKHFIEIGL